MYFRGCLGELGADLVRTELFFSSSFVVVWHCNGRQSILQELPSTWLFQAGQLDWVQHSSDRSAQNTLRSLVTSVLDACTVLAVGTGR